MSLFNELIVLICTISLSEDSTSALKQRCTAHGHGEVIPFLLVLQLDLLHLEGFSIEHCSLVAMDVLQHSEHVGKSQGRHLLLEHNLEFASCNKDPFHEQRLVVFRRHVVEIEFDIFLDVLICKNHSNFSVSSDFVHDVFDDFETESFLSKVFEGKLNHALFEICELLNGLLGLVQLLGWIIQFIQFLSLLHESLGVQGPQLLAVVLLLLRGTTTIWVDHLTIDQELQMLTDVHPLPEAFDEVNCIN